MAKNTACAILLSFWFTAAAAGDSAESSVPNIPVEQAIAVAKRHIKSEGLDVSRHYLASAEWIVRPSAPGIWRIEWRNKKLVKGGQVIVTIDASGKVQHGFGE